MSGPPPPTRAFPSHDCLGVEVDLLTWDDFLEWFLEQVRGARKACRSVFIVNAHTLNLACADPRLREVLDSGALVLNDGVGLDAYGWVHGHPFAHNFIGTDLVPDVLRACARRDLPLSLFLFGARPGRAEAAAEALAAAHPGVRIAGTLHGYEFDDAAVVAAVNAARPDLLLVALGNPLQEQWLARHAPHLEARVAMGVGALFDYLSGAVPRAPRALRALRLEWLFRLLLEPRRMFHRYVVGNPLFLWRTLTYRPRGARRA